MSSGAQLELHPQGIIASLGGSVWFCAIDTKNTTLDGSNLVFDKPIDLLLMDPINGSRIELEHVITAPRGSRATRSLSPSLLGRRDDSASLCLWYRRGGTEIRFSLACQSVSRHAHRPAWIATQLRAVRFDITPNSLRPASRPHVRYEPDSEMETLVAASQAELARARQLVIGGGFAMRKL